MCLPREFTLHKILRDMCKKKGLEIQKKKTTMNLGYYILLEDVMYILKNIIKCMEYPMNMRITSRVP